MKPNTAAVTAEPQGCTNFKLRQLLRSVSRLYDAEIAHAGLKSTQFSLLANLRHGSGLAIGELAARMSMDRSTLTRNLRPLIDHGWVLQGPGADARSRLVTITPAGMAKHAEARQHWKRAQQQLVQRLGAQQVAQLHQLMALAQQNLQDLPATDVADA